MGPCLRRGDGVWVGVVMSAPRTLHRPLASAGLRLGGVADGLWPARVLEPNERGFGA